jgi:hypothetical protein
LSFRSRRSTHGSERIPASNLVYDQYLKDAQGNDSLGADAYPSDTTKTAKQTTGV